MVIRIAQAYARGDWNAVANGQPEDSYQGVYPARSDDGQTGGTPNNASRKPAQQKETRAGNTGSGSSKPSTKSGTSRPSTPTAARPYIPTAQPKPPVNPPSVPAAPSVQTTVGKITGTSGSTTAQLQRAVGYCQQMMHDDQIPVTQARSQSCSNA